MGVTIDAVARRSRFGTLRYEHAGPTPPGLDFQRLLIIFQIMDYDLDYLHLRVESTGKHDCAPRLESLAPSLFRKGRGKGWGTPASPPITY